MSLPKTHLRSLSIQRSFRPIAGISRSFLHVQPSRSIATLLVRPSVITPRYTPSLRFASTSASASSSSSAEGQESPNSDPEPTSAYAKFKALTKKYGSWALGMYLFLSSIDFTITFLLVHSVGAERIEPLLDSGKAFYREKRYGPEEAERLRIKDEEEKIEAKELEKKEGKKAGNAAWLSRTFWAEAVLAYTIHKTLLLPLRAGLTVAWTPKFVGWLTSRGWVGKGGLARAASHAQGKVKGASDRMKDRVKRPKE